MNQQVHYLLTNIGARWMGTITRRRDVVIVMVGPQESKEVGGMVFWGHTPTGAVHRCVDFMQYFVKIVIL